MTVRLRAARNDLPLVLLIGGVNSGKKSTLWNFENLGFPGEFRTIPWDSKLEIPEGLQVANPLELVKTAIRYVQVVQNAELKGESIGEELLSGDSSRRKIIVIAHSMGTRCAAALTKYCAKHCSLERREFPIRQLLLFNGAAPIHSSWNLRDILLKGSDAQGYNFFNPLDPVISSLAIVCRLLEGVFFTRIPPALKALFKGASSSSYFSPPIGHCPTTTIPYNYNVSAVQKIDHSIGALEQYISYNQLNNVFELTPEVERLGVMPLPTTFNEVVDDLFKSVFKDPFKRPEDYVRTLSAEQSMVVNSSNEALQRTEEVIKSIASLARQFLQSPNVEEEFEGLIQEYSMALKEGALNRRLKNKISSLDLN